MANDIKKRESFEILCLHLIKKYNMNVGLLMIETTKEIFRLVKDTSNKYLMATNIKKMNIGQFYLIQYNYNGNKIWCPIFTIEYKVINNKNILYAINLDYLPYKFKILFINKLFYIYNDTIEKSQKAYNVKNETPMKDIDFEKIYKLLKNNGDFEYSITAFDLSKIRKVYAVSYDLIHRFIFLRTKMVNSEEMKKTLITEEDLENRKKLEKLIEALDDLDKKYDIELKEYYKKLKDIESKYKLTEN